VSVTTLLLGRRLANREAEGRKIGAFEGLPAMGLDGLGSASYGPEAMLAVLAVAGAAGLRAVQPITWIILLLLTILFLSYWQTIAAYPNNGGCYAVARENLGEDAGLLASAALMIDYVLNVAVGISAGVGALTSAVPMLHPYTLPLCLGILAAITLVNLRGTKESGLALAVPTYLFIASLFFILGVGVWTAWTSGGHPQPVVPPPEGAAAAGAVTLWLVLRAFAAGCTAMTGVEAVGNGIGAFKDPTVKHAHRTLAAICAVLGLLLLGIAYLAQAYGIRAMDQNAEPYQSVISQLVGAVWGRDWVYFVTIGSVLAVLCLSANTSFVGFPRLCRLVAEDGFLPRPFAVSGRRLVFDVGILYLSATAALLLVAFDGITDRLIPMFAIGAFLTFTLSQSGMVVHWSREQRKTEHVDTRVGARQAINAIGAITTALALAIILTTKFTEGAWITVMVIPAVIFLLLKIRQYYDEVGARTRKTDPLVLTHTEPPIVIVPTEEWSRLTDKALAFALQISPDVVGVHLTSLTGPDDDPGREARLREQWRTDVEEPARAAGLTPPRLVVLPSGYRSIRDPLLKFIAEIEEMRPHRLIAVVIPELVKLTWWQHVLHTHRARRLRAALLRYGGSRLVVMNIPWYLEEPRPIEALEEDNPTRARFRLNRARAR